MELEDLKFTKELKENWLNALKSGKYKQVNGQLKDYEGHCCLGVLAEIHPDLSIESEGKRCVFNGKVEGYEPFEKILTTEIVDKLYIENDSSYREGVEDFSTVIPLIEKLPTVD
jgi:ASC-1-like (ASCH) protein